MFGKKLVLIAAAVALTMSHVAAVDEASHVKVQVSKSGVKHNVVKHHAAKHHAVKHHSKPVVKHAKHAKKAHVKQSDDESGSGDDDDDEKITIEIEIDYSDPEKYCTEGWSPMSVEGIEGIFCVSGQACVDDIDGSCPVPQQGLEFGAYCGEVKTGVMGCKPMTEEMWWQTQGGDDNGNNSGPVCGDGFSPMSVEGVEGVFCVEGQACVADIDGACPGPQDDLEYGSYCGTVKTGVKGCKPYTEDQTPEPTAEPTETDDTCEEGSTPMSVEGVEGIFCVEGQACAGVNGTCPDAQDGLEFGSYCGKVKTGVLGCKPYADETQTPEEDDGTEVIVEVCDDGWSPMSVEGVEGVFCVEGQACAGVNGTCPEAQDGLEFGSYCGKVSSGVLGCKPYADDSHTPDEDDEPTEEPTETDDTCDEGSSPMSVEGVEGVFCVEGQACAGVEGSCPGPQDGLEFGSYCGKVASGVLGCKPNTEAPPPADDDEFCSGEGESQMSVEGVEGVFCVSGQACAGVQGACPGPQDGLEFGSYCGNVASGVLGCKPNTSKKMMKHHKVTHPAKKHHKKAHGAATAKKNTEAHAKTHGNKKVHAKVTHAKKPRTVVKKVHANKH